MQNGTPVHSRNLHHKHEPMLTINFGIPFPRSMHEKKANFAALEDLQSTKSANNIAQILRSAPKSNIMPLMQLI
jgi:hypothetical protein